MGNKGSVAHSSKKNELKNKLIRILFQIPYLPFQTYPNDNLHYFPFKENTRKNLIILLYEQISATYNIIFPLHISVITHITYKMLITQKCEKQTYLY